MIGSIFFAVCSIVALLGAIVTIAARNPIRGAVGLLATIVAIAGLFLRLNAEFMAAIQLIVYAGAVVVLFVFVIMLLGPDAGAGADGVPKARAARAFAGVLMAALAAIGGGLVFSATTKLTALGDYPADLDGERFGGVEAVGRLLFSKGLVAFELSTALLIVAVIGAIAVARARHKQKAEKVIENPTTRMFHGPLHPRDAGRPLPKEQV